MNRHPTLNRLTLSTAALAGLLLSAPAQAQDVHGQFESLAGTWSGDGVVTMANGSNERIRCRASYSVPPNGMSLNQGLRCASDSYTFDVKTNLVADDAGTLSGTWREMTRQVTGQLTGQVTPGLIKTSVEALGFSAHLSVATHGARQSVSLQPDGTDVKIVTIELRRT